ncbi:protein FAM169B-like isoform X2 [Lissotriton helveticus]
MDILAESDPELFWETTNRYYSSLLQQSSSSQEFFSPTDGKQVKIGIASVSRVPLYRDDTEHSILVLMNPLCKETGLAVHINESWRSIEDILRTSNTLKDGLIPVQSFGERIVLFVLNCLIFGALEKDDEGEDAAFFVPHSCREDAKIFWQHGEAVGFYTVKPKGCLCDGRTSQCYLLPVLDTAFVRRSHRRRGLMTTMLEDFCRRFSTYDTLGFSYPLSTAMYRVCQKFLWSHPEEQDRLWEVVAPGDWSQRENIWLKIQLRQRMSVLQEAPEDSFKEANVCSVKRDVEEISSQSSVGQIIEGVVDFPKFDKASEVVLDRKEMRASNDCEEETVQKLMDPLSLVKNPNKRKHQQDDNGDSSYKQCKSGS